MRCFIALVPPVDTAREIERCVDALCEAAPCARRVATANLHLTLAFIGALAEPEARRVAAALREIDPAAFAATTWMLDRIGRFDRARVIWIGGAPNGVLEGYSQAVRSMLNRLNVPFDPKPFVPHLTVLRDARMRDALPPVRISAAWPLPRPQLMQSLHLADDMRYRVVD